MTTSPPQPPQNPYPAEPAAGGYGPPPVQPGPTVPPGPHDQPQYGQPSQQGQFPQYGPQDQQNQFQQNGQYAPPVQQGQYPQQGQFPQGQFAQGEFAPVVQGTLQCRFCGAVPAVQATVRGHQGLIIMMRFLKLEGPFCRTCGVASVRNMTAKSLWQGWWGLGSMIINPITMLINLGTWTTFKNLPEPAPGAPGRPMDPGKPLFKRPVVLALLIPIAVIPVAVIALLVIGILANPSSADVGDCIQNKGTVNSPNVEVVDCGSADAQYKIIGKLDNSANSDECEQFQGYTVAYTEERGSSKYTLCLAPN